MKHLALFTSIRKINPFIKLNTVFKHRYISLLAVVNIMICIMLATNCDAQNSGNNSSVGGGFTSPQSKIFTSSKSSGKKKSSSNNKIGSFKLKQRPLVGGRDYSNSKPSYRSSNKKNKSLNGSFLRPQKTPSFSSKGSPFGNSHRMPSNKDHSKGQLQSSFQQAPFVPKSDALPLNTFF